MVTTTTTATFYLIIVVIDSNRDAPAIVVNYQFNGVNILNYSAMNKLFLVAAMRTRRQINVSFEIEVIDVHFDHKRMDIKLVNNSDHNKAIAAGLQPDDYGYISIDLKHDFVNDDIVYNIVGEI